MLRLTGVKFQKCYTALIKINDRLKIVPFFFVPPDNSKVCDCPLTKKITFTLNELWDKASKVQSFNDLSSRAASLTLIVGSTRYSITIMQTVLQDRLKRTIIWFLPNPESNILVEKAALHYITCIQTAHISNR